MNSQERTRRNRTTPLPQDFPRSLERLKDASALGWMALSRRLDVDYQRVRSWRRGSEPAGGAMLTICRLAAGVPGALAELLGEEIIGGRPSEEERE